MLRFLSSPELKQWKENGLLMGRASADLAKVYFKEIPEGLDALYRTEAKRIFDIIALIAGYSPEKALAFYQACPGMLLALNPNIRENALKAALKISCDRPEKISGAFDTIVSALLSLSYPTQEAVLDLETMIGKASIDAAKAYFKTLAFLLSEISESFLPHWVKKGLSLLETNIQGGIDYCSLDSQEAQDERVKWKEAVLFEDCQQLFSIYVHSLSGKKLRLKSTEDLDPADASPVRYHPSSDEHTIYLPPVITEGRTKAANFRLYKVSAAHQAGTIEFGTFDPAYAIIWPVLDSFPFKALVTDIFFIIEDGRVDHQLKKEYRGLKPEMDLSVSEAIKRRPFPKEPPILAAMEILLRLSAGHHDRRRIPEALSKQVDFLTATLDGFFEKAQTVWDSFLKTAEIYEVLYPLITQGAYVPVIPLLFHERPDPADLPGSGVREDLPDEIKKPDPGEDAGGAPLSPEELKKLLEEMDDLTLLESLEEELSSKGLYLTSLEGLEIEAGEKKADAEENARKNRPIVTPVSRTTDHKGPFFYDEWDYLQGAYRKKWCCLREKRIDARSPARFNEISANYRDLIQRVRKQFQQIRPENLEPIRRVEWGDEIDLQALIEGVVDRKTGGSPSEKIFSRKEKKIRRVSTLLLIDMSASTDEKASFLVPSAAPSGQNASLQNPDQAPDGDQRRQQDKKIIDIEIESLVVMTEALDALGDDYAIFGFSGQGRENVDFYAIKDFKAPYSEDLKKRISGIEPKQSTRMGPAIRHAADKLRNVEAEHRLLILLSDGFPQDLDYGEDRKSKEYELNDTMMALIEAKNQEIRPFCITVDQAGNDYLRKMCDPRSYLIIKDIYSLPEILPKVVESLMD